MFVAYISAISTEGMYNLPLFKDEKTLATIVFWTSADEAEVLAAVDTKKKFSVFYEYKDSEGKNQRSSYPMEVKFATDIKGNLQILGDSTAFHTSIKL